MIDFNFIEVILFDQAGDPYCGKRHGSDHSFFNPGPSGGIAGNGGKSGKGKQPAKPSGKPLRKIDDTPYDVSYYNRMKDQEDKKKRAAAGRDRYLARLCGDFNAGTCNDETKCGKMHKCSRVVKITVHGQERDRICGADHKNPDHQ